jgi:signal transduction histidine kinase
MSDENYYKVGGSLEYQHPTYVVRQADSDLYEGLKNGEFCYVLNSRQMGKSSLRVQMMKKLKEQGVKCASIDMTRIGSHVTPQEWYAGIVSELLRGFGLKKVNFSSWWRERELLPPLQRLRELIEDVLLTEFSQNLVIFIDEIDCILKVKFKDDFFGFIRACYNQRVDNSEYQRLTFCLLGVATPSDLIADKQRTPFNIGQAIELTGFKLEEAILALTHGLAQKVDNPEWVVKEVLAWTGGQPFLTQKLCQLVVEKAQSRKPKIDELAQKYLIDNWQAQDEPEHLKTIRDRLLSNEQHNSRLLGLYQQILQQGEIAADESPEQIELRLSGMVVKQQGCLRVYNRIYQAVFDLSWVEKELAALRPYSEAFKAWLASGCMDESRLLRGQALQDALAWAANKSLSGQDNQFLRASQEWDNRETRKALEAEYRVNRAKDEFLATLSHLLRTPLNGIMGWTNLLRNRKFDDATTDRALETIARNAESLLKMIEDLLDQSRLLRGKLSLNGCLVELVPVIEAAIDTALPAIDAKKIRFESTLDPAVGQVLGDSDRLRRVIWNLLSNAVKFTPQGGYIEVRLEIINSCAQIRVSHTGKGIAPDFLPYVFDCFRQDDSTIRSYGGFGFELVTVRHLVELHGGSVHAESPGEGQGATFIVNLPLMPVRVELGEHEQV